MAATSAAAGVDVGGAGRLDFEAVGVSYRSDRVILKT